MAFPHRTSAGLSAVLACLALAAPAWALGPGSGPGGPVGGPLLASPGVVAELAPGVPALPAPLPASSWLVADAGTGAVLAAKDAHGRFLPASTLKVLTALTLLPRLNPDQLVTVTPAEQNIDGSKVGLVAGYHYPVWMLFTAMLVVSGNDAAQALAGAAGGVPATLAAMNAEARYLHADDTFAGTPSGLDAPGESSSAYDLALIGRAAIALPSFRHYDEVVTSYVSAPSGHPFQIYTHDRLLTSYPGAIGVKNGYTIAAEGTYIGAATRGGRTIIVTLMHANPNFWPMAAALLNWGFAVDGKIAPVGRLVAAGIPSPPAAPAVGRSRISASGPARSGSPLDIPLALAGASLVATAALSWRNHRRWSGRRSKVGIARTSGTRPG
jgi:D-alanyl-D-alanine carboxypeptidase (penicillin-binding protein 5/6)